MRKENKARGDLPRVTHIIEACGLINTAFYTEAGANRGTDIHLLTQLIDEGLLKYNDVVNNEYEGWLSAYFNFLNENEVIIKEIEKTVIYKGQYPYKGHIDRIAIVNGEKYIIDIKTGQIIKWHGIQLAGYGLAYDVEVKRAILKLEKNGKYRFKTKIKYDLNSPKWGYDWWGCLQGYYKIWEAK